MSNQGSALRRRRGQKQKCNLESSRKSSESETLKHIRRLDSAFTKILLCVAVLCVGKNILLSYRRHGSVLGEAFQSNDTRGRWKKRFNGLHWPLFGNRRTSHSVPTELLQPFGSYPNILNISPEMRSTFHPVVKIPLRKAEEGQQNTSDEDSLSCNELGRKMNETYDYLLKDYTGNNEADNRVLLEGGERVPQLLLTREEALHYATIPKSAKYYDVGRYDEDRSRQMYSSSLFEGEHGSGKENRRTIHIGLDIGAPVGTTVYAFEDGKVHSAGYNPAVGDYGHVIVIEHYLKNGQEISKIYALYGHLGAKSIQGKLPGTTVKKGEAIGYLGNTAENGGWTGS
ncbi:hypothetical protein ACHAWF_016972 [Thalassiosira exigua]